MNSNRSQHQESSLDEWNLSNIKTNVSQTSFQSYQSQRTHSSNQSSLDSLSFNSDSAIVQRHRLLHRRRYSEISINGNLFFYE
jgi:hypothetical protein